MYIAALLENLSVPQRVNKFPTFYEIWEFITTFTQAHQRDSNIQLQT
jgi:hypothetical protein